MSSRLSQLRHVYELLYIISNFNKSFKVGAEQILAHDVLP